MKPWLTVIGVGAAGISELPAASRALLQNASVIAGGKRQLAMLADIEISESVKRISLSEKFSEKLKELLACRGESTCVLASGDPMCFGIGATLTRYVDANEMHILPQPSAFALASARLCWPQQALTTVSLHGRPVETLNAHLYHGCRILALTSDAQTLPAVVTLLKQKGFSDSKLTALCNLGVKDEQVLQAPALNWQHENLPDLYTLAIECVADKDTTILSSASGLADECYEHDGQLTKREVRAVTIAMLKPQPGALLWDLGAGCGSISIEWMRAARNARAVAVEQNENRANIIARNALSLGAPTLKVLRQTNELMLSNESKGDESPDAIFIGGGLREITMLQNAYEKLNPRGRLVANAVTLETENTLTRFQQQFGGSLTRIEISRAKPIGEQQAWQAAKPVTQLALGKA